MTVDPRLIRTPRIFTHFYVVYVYIYQVKTMSARLLRNGESIQTSWGRVSEMKRSKTAYHPSCVGFLQYKLEGNAI